MPNGPANHDQTETVPAWVPRAALNYLAHTEGGTSIRALAREAGCHASTVSRQVRAFEARRDDLLVDEALRRLGRKVRPYAEKRSPTKETRMRSSESCFKNTNEATPLTQARLNAEAARILRRLGENGAVLAVAAEMEKAVVIRETGDGASSRLAVVDREIAEAMALKGWIGCAAPGRVSRYRITAAGRTALGQILAETENQASGFAEAAADFDGAGGAAAGTEGGRRRMRYGATETPLVLLARRRDRHGQRFLSEELVRAGERLREDFEMAQLGPRIGQNWDSFLTAGVEAASAPGGAPAGGSGAARARVLGALRDLGPGLADVALRCCCYLEGLETVEKKLGWSARSGKIVLRIALQRLKRHYDDLGDSAHMMG